MGTLTETEERREAKENGEQSEPETGLFGSQIVANLPRAVAAEVVGTFVLVFTKNGGRGQRRPRQGDRGSRI